MTKIATVGTVLTVAIFPHLSYPPLLFKNDSLRGAALYKPMGVWRLATLLSAIVLKSKGNIFDASLTTVVLKGECHSRARYF